MTPIAVAAGSLAAAATIAIGVAASADGPAPGLVGAAGVALLGLALAARRPGLVPVALVLLGAGYALALQARSDVVDGRAVLLAPVFLVAAELAYWSFEPHAIRAGREVVAPRLAVLAALAASAALAAAFLVGTTSIGVSGTAAVVAAGVLAATGALALSARLARRG